VIRNRHPGAFPAQHQRLYRLRSGECALSSAEKGAVTPILGMEKYYSEMIAPQNLQGVRTWPAPGKESKSNTHGGFDDDATTMASVIALIQGKTP